MAENIGGVSLRKEVFELDADLLAQYPEMQRLSGHPMARVPRDALVVSAVFHAGKTGARFLERVGTDQPTGCVEYQMHMVRTGLLELVLLDKDGEYEPFIDAETAQLKEFEFTALSVIGSLHREIDGVYR